MPRQPPRCRVTDTLLPSMTLVRSVQVEVVGGGPVFDIDNLYPGASTDSTVRVTNLRAEPGNLTLSAVDIVDESKCSPAENRAGMPCGGGIVGALGAQVVLTIEIGRAHV